MSTASDTWKDAAIMLLATPFLMFAAAASSALPLMIGLGIAHADISAHVPALGFWSTLGLSWGLGALVGKFRPYVPKRGAK